MLFRSVSPAPLPVNDAAVMPPVLVMVTTSVPVLLNPRASFPEALVFWKIKPAAEELELEAWAKTPAELPVAPVAWPNTPAAQHPLAPVFELVPNTPYVLPLPIPVDSPRTPAVFVDVLAVRPCTPRTAPVRPSASPCIAMELSVVLAVVPRIPSVAPLTALFVPNKAAPEPACDTDRI